MGDRANLRLVSNDSAFAANVANTALSTTVATYGQSSATLSPLIGAGYSFDVPAAAWNPETSGEMMNGTNDNSALTDSKIAAAEARSETKIVRLEGKIDLILSKLSDAAESQRSMRTNIWAVGGSLAVLMVALVALMPVFYDLGSKNRETIANEVKEQVAKQRPTAPEPAPGRGEGQPPLKR